jgi:hypothetical protein
MKMVKFLVAVLACCGLLFTASAYANPCIQKGQVDPWPGGMCCQGLNDQQLICGACPCPPGGRPCSLKECCPANATTPPGYPCTNQATCADCCNGHSVVNGSYNVCCAAPQQYCSRTVNDPCIRLGCHPIPYPTSNCCDPAAICQNVSSTCCIPEDLRNTGGTCTADADCCDFAGGGRCANNKCCLVPGNTFKCWAPWQCCTGVCNVVTGMCL